MNTNYEGYYIIKVSRCNDRIQWINAVINIYAQIDRYYVEIKHVGEEDLIYDEDEDDKGIQKVTKLNLKHFKNCELRGSQRFQDNTIHVLVLIPKRFSRVNKLFLAFQSEDIQLICFNQLKLILSNKHEEASPRVVTPTFNFTVPEESFMIENDMYECNLGEGEFSAIVIDNDKSKALSMSGQCVLKVTEEGIQFREEKEQSAFNVWKMNSIRKFGMKEDIFCLELGLSHKDGPGVLSFKITKYRAFWDEFRKCRDVCVRQMKYNSMFDTDDNESLPNSNSSSVKRSIPKKRISLMDNNRKTIFEPPKMAPPLLPKEILNSILEKTNLID